MSLIRRAIPSFNHRVVARRFAVHGALVILQAALASTAMAQDTTDSPKARFEIGLGVTRRLPAIADPGTGAIGSINVRTPVHKGGVGFVAGVTFGILPLRYDLPDGSPNNSAIQSVFLSLGPEFRLGEQAQFDLQWNPALTGVRRWGAQPSWRTATPVQRSLTSASVGLRLGKPNAKLGCVFRLHTSLHLFDLVTGGTLQNTYPSVQVLWRP
jgi:hypothetical protein